MLGSSPVTAFLPSTDPVRSRAFYEGLLGLTVTASDGFALVLEGAGTTIRVTRVETFTPQPFTALGWVVQDIARVMSQLAEQSVEFVVFEGMGQDADGVWTAPGGHRIAWFKDPDANLLSLTQYA
ncbi:VOC family protein [Streptacidiphilus sp. N1-12]|uniref:VOC family protein n=2 Tax=Streptacidiphilus alkalitolerans TaxID=3342712 RepID=A0ABV6VI79_9ACTN